MDSKGLSANWKKLQNKLKAQETRQEKPSRTQKRKREDISSSRSSRKPNERPQKKPRHDTHLRTRVRQMQSSKPMVNGDTPAAKVSNPAKDNVNAGLCKEYVLTLGPGMISLILIASRLASMLLLTVKMVGVGPQPDLESALARVSVVNYDGHQIYDSYVKPKEMVTDWRTHVSGIMPRHMAVARSFEEVQKTVSDILQDRILIGHSLSHDLDALLLSHSRRDIRDTARHPAYRKLAGGSSPRLKILASELLGVDIQAGEHSSIEDARACMMLFRRDKTAFEHEHAKKFPAPKLPPPSTENGEVGRKKRKKKKKKK